MSTTDPDALLGPADIRELAAALGVRPTKQRGQNFVIDANTVRRIVRTADVRPADTVLEVGPGLGSLTLALLEAADRVTAIEIDDVLAGALPATVAARMPQRADRFTLVHSDAMTVRELPGPPPTALVANLPYNVAVPVLLHMLATFPTIERTLVMVQAEVADRLAARPGQQGVRGAVGEGELVRGGQAGRRDRAQRLLAGAERRLRPGLPGAPRPAEDHGARARTSSRRSTRRSPSAARRCARRSPAGPVRPPPRRPRCVAAGVSPQARGEALTVEQFAAIAEHRPV